MNELEFYEDLIGLADLKVTSLEKHPKKLIVHCQYTKTTGNCPSCLEETSQINQMEVRQFRDLKISEREVWLHVEIPQFYCPRCNRYSSQNPEWVERGKSYTKRQAKWIFEMCEKQAFSQVAALVDMCPKTVERLFYNYAEQWVKLKERYANVRHLGIDEIAHEKGKKHYACVLTDLERGIQIDVLPSRKKEDLMAHFQLLGEDFAQQIEVVCCDMWDAYAEVAKSCFPNCEVVIDRFHVVRALNQVLDIQRKELRKENQDEPCYKRLKWTLFKRPENCDEEELVSLQDAFEKSWQLGELYALRNTFHAIFDLELDETCLNEVLQDWIEHAQKLTYSPLNRFVKTLQNWKTEITNFTKHRITNAVTEGLNNYLRYFKRISFGLPSFEHMRMRILVASS